tara:strand:+ start:286 stop:1134 length:849 start_codon:yes stop_codon:yes gene_type:complete
MGFFWFKTKIRNGILFVLVLFNSSMAAAGPLSDIAKEILPHEAAYELDLEHVVSGSQLVHAEGFMSYNWKRRCDGWTSEQRLFLALTYPENKIIKFRAMSVTWESEDGLRFRFNISRGANGEETEKYAGEAILDEVGGPGRVYYENPKGKEVLLDRGTIFPSRHTLLLLKRAVNVARFDRQLVFDGGDLSGSAAVTAIFFPKQKAIKLKKLVKGYDPKPVYPMKLSFFPPVSADLKADILPDAEYKVFYQADGVAPVLYLNFSEFKFRGDMVAFARLKRPVC